MQSRLFACIHLCLWGYAQVPVHSFTVRDITLSVNNHLRSPKNQNIFLLHAEIPDKSNHNIGIEDDQEPGGKLQKIDKKTDANKSKNIGDTVVMLENARDAALSASMNLLSKVRWGAAKVLTSTLPDTQRDELLDRLMTEKSPDQDIHLERGSVQEEIALTLATEARQSEEMWGDEKEQVSKQVDDAAKARVQNELLVQKMRFDGETSTSTREPSKLGYVYYDGEEPTTLENNVLRNNAEIAMKEEKLTELERDIEEIKKRRAAELPDEESKEDKKALQVLDGVGSEDEELVDLNDEEDELKPYDVDTDAQMGMDEIHSDMNVHPVLGKPIGDLGYKQIHLVSADKLGTIPVWNKNRIYRHNRAQAMALDKTKTMSLGFPGVVCLHEDLNGKLSILDGQHRVGMMAALREVRKMEAAEMNTTIPADEIALFDQVLVEVYRQDPESELNGYGHAQQVFLEINKAEPVKLVDMPGVASSTDRIVITEAVDYLRSSFPRMFSPSQRCRIPNVNVDNLRNNIFGANVLNRHKLESSKELFDWLLVQNAALGEKYESNENNRRLISRRAWEKTTMNGFYLGLESSWLYK